MSDNSRGLEAWGIAFLRVVVGVIFFMHGGQKLFMLGLNNVAAMMGQLGFPLPMLTAVVVAVVEFVGGIALILGLFSRGAAFLLAIEMLVAVVAVHLKGGFFLPRGVEYALTQLAANVVLTLAGPGAASLGSAVGKHRL